MAIYGHLMVQPRSQGPLSSSLEKVPWLRLVMCLCIQIKSKPGMGLWLNCVYGGESCFALPYRRYFESEEVICQRSCLTGASFISELLWVWDVDWEGSLLIFTTFLNNRQQPVEFRISLISFSQHSRILTISVKFSMGFIQFNEKLVSQPKIGLTAKQFWNESRWILQTRGRCRLQSSSSINFSLQENWITVKFSNEWIQSNSKLVSWPNTRRIKL